MPRVLCYGDSNTWGSIPKLYTRYDECERWPALLRAHLPESYEVIEEGQTGRTTAHDDPEEANSNGLSFLGPCLERHQPDLVLIMLGTNDLKQCFNLSAYDISEGASKLVRCVFSFIGKGKQTSPNVLLISPPPIYEVGYFAGVFAGGALKSLDLKMYYEQCAKKLGCSFMDAGSVVRSCDKEGIHWDARQHRLLAKALSLQVQGALDCY